MIHQLPVSHLIRTMIDGGKTPDSLEVASIRLLEAVLRLRFPETGITRLDGTVLRGTSKIIRAGCLVNDTVLYVCARPDVSDMDLCREILKSGLYVWLLVPHDYEKRAKALSQTSRLLDRVAIGALEEFMGGIVERMALYRNSEIEKIVRSLVTCGSLDYDCSSDILDPFQPHLVVPTSGETI